MNSPRIGYALWDIVPDLHEAELHQVLGEITMHFIKLKSPEILDLMRDHSLTRILHRQSEIGQTWAAIFSPGLILQSGFFKQLRGTLSELDPKNAPLSLSWGRAFLLVNLEKWKTDGHPRFHEWEKGVDLPEALASRLIALAPTPNSEIIRSCLAQITQPNWNQAAPKGILTAGQEQALQHLHFEAADPGNLVFLFNNEGYFEVNEQNPKPQLDGLFTVASGFKDLYILDRHGTRPDTSVTYFDFCPSALAFKQCLFAHWDGVDFPRFFSRLKAAMPNELRDVKFAEPQSKIEALWEAELKAWGGAERFQHAFQVAKSLPKTYLSLNVLEDPTALSQAIRATPGHSFAVWYSNCFNYTPAVAHYGWNRDWIERQGLTFLRSLASAAAKPEERRLLLYGEDVVRGSRCFRASSWAHEVFN